MKILILGGSGLVGSSILRGSTINHEVFAPTKSNLNLLYSSDLVEFFTHQRIDVVVNAAGLSAGIQGNLDKPVDLMLINAKITNTVLEICHQFRIPKVLNFASACVYPISSMSNSKPDDLGAGSIEKTSEKYAYAKIYGIKLVESYRNQFNVDWSTIIPTNIYGPNDWHHGENGHVIPMMAEKIYRAKSMNASDVTFWGTGNAMRNFLHVDDLASAVWQLIDSDLNLENIFNVSGSEELTMLQLAKLIATELGYSGKVLFDSSKPEGVKKKRLDDEVIRSLGWKPGIPIQAGIHEYIKLRF
jgi:GDP-L-fucose synthase